MHTQSHILVVEDEPAVSALLRKGFEASGYVVSEARGKDDLLRKLSTEPIDLITLDLELGNEDGLVVAREIRAKQNLPIIMITGKGAPDDRAVGLEGGADDYIVKPFNMREVLHRTRVVLDRYRTEVSNSSASQKAVPGEFYFEVGALNVKRRDAVDQSGKSFELTGAEFDLLLIFLRNPARILSRDELSQQVLKRDWSPLERAIDGHIAKLRKKIEPDGEAPRLIKSVRGVGYVFTGDVQQL